MSTLPPRMTDPAWVTESVMQKQCKACLFYDPDKNGSVRCSAFPVAIPMAILRGEHDHRFAYPGDRGIRFMPK